MLIIQTYFNKILRKCKLLGNILKRRYVGFKGNFATYGYQVELIYTNALL
jgi:hypothetical protein